MAVPPHGLIEIAIEPKSMADMERLATAMTKIVGDDPSLTVHADRESGQTIMAGMGERHLSLAIDTLRRTYEVDVDVGAPQVAYRETIGCAAEIDYTYRMQTGKFSQFSRVTIAFYPGKRGSGFQFKSDCRFISLEFMSGVINGLETERANGLVAGFPLIDTQATLVDVAYHDTDSSKEAFEVAARAAFRELREKGAPKLLEPIMEVEVVTPEDYVVDIISDLNSRRGHIQSTGSRGAAQVVTSLVPLANMFGYVGNLRHLSQSLAQFTMQYDRYEAVPLPQPTPPDDSYLADMGMRA